MFLCIYYRTLCLSDFRENLKLDTRVPAEGWLGRSVDHFHSMLYCWPRWLDLCEAAACERENLKLDK